MSHTLQEKYSSLVDAKLRATLTTKDGAIFNANYEGDPAAGSVKIPIRDTEVAVNNYDRGSGADLTEGSTSYLTLAIDKDVVVNELIDGYDAAAVPDGITADRLDSAGYALGLRMESDAIAVLEDTDADGTATLFSTKTLTADNVYAEFVAARKAMSKNKIPIAGRWALVSPDTYATLLLDEKHFIRATDLGDEILAEGQVGKIAGFAVFECVNLSETTNFIVGHPNWCHRVQAWQVPVHLQDLNGSGKYIGASAVQGRKVYAHTVSKPQTVLVCKNSGNLVIGAAAYSVTQPAKSGTPQSSFASGTGYTGAISWSPVAATFAASTVYTATVVLTAADGYQFDAGFSATDVTGLPATSGSGKTASAVTVVRDSDTQVTITVKYVATAA